MQINCGKLRTGVIEIPGATINPIIIPTIVITSTLHIKTQNYFTCVIKYLYGRTNPAVDPDNPAVDPNYSAVAGFLGHIYTEKTEKINIINIYVYVYI